jgi:hypothetical protein
MYTRTLTEAIGELSMEEFERRLRMIVECHFGTVDDAMRERAERIVKDIAEREMRQALKDILAEQRETIQTLARLIEKGAKG